MISPSHGESGGAYGSNSGISLSLAPATPHFDPFSLEVGQHHTFDFINATFNHHGWSYGSWSNSTWVDAGIVFDAPAMTAWGRAEVRRFMEWGEYAGASFHWTTQPGEIVAANGYIFDVRFSEFDVTPGYRWIDAVGGDAAYSQHYSVWDWEKHQTVQATVTLVEGPIQVPAPAPYALLGIGLLGLTVVRWRRGGTDPYLPDTPLAVAP